jgi:endonuclease I
MASIKSKYDISSDWTGSAYCGLKLYWYYTNGIVDLYMPGYINAELHKYQHPEPTNPEHVPHQWNLPVYGVKTQ